MYKFEEVLESANQYFNGNNLAADIWAKKYALKDGDGNYHEKNPEDMHHRLAKEFARIEQNYSDPMTEDEIFSLFDQFKYIIPQGSPMYGVGNPYQVISQSNCFAIATIDSYGGICRADERIAQISKRRGGCVEENSFVQVLGRGIIMIKDVKIGDQVLSYNIETNKSEYKTVLDHYYTDVEKTNQIKIGLTNGFEIRTSKKHPVLVLRNDKFQYERAGNLSTNDICIIPETGNPVLTELLDFDAKLTDIGWFIGAHTGDGSLGKIKKPWNKTLPKGLRLRILGDNENVVREFALICNGLTESESNYHVSTRKNYKTKCWEYINNTNALASLAEKYFDNKIGRKCYDCHVFSFIEKNNLWLPYLAGLVDTDGHVKSDGTIDIGICAKEIVSKLSSVLAASGIRISVKEKHTKRTNEKTLYRLKITDERFHAVLVNYLRHDIKHDKLVASQASKRLFSLAYPLTESERSEILEEYQSRKYLRSVPKGKRHTNMVAIIALLKKSCSLGFGGMMVLKEHDLLTHSKITNIMQRRQIKSIQKETEDLKYVDISVEGNNNYYAGTKGLINIHNCGIDISPIRPKGLPTHNAAQTTDGIVVFMKRFSNTAKEVAQHGRRGALMISCSVHHPEIMSFIQSKAELEAITGANISVRLTDEFMNAVKEDKDFELRWPVDSKNPTMIQSVKAKTIWDEIVRHAFLRAEPGVLFWDTITKNSPADCYPEEGFETVTTNPCSELPLAEGSSCILMLLNLASYVVNPFTDKAVFDYKLYEKHVRKAMRLLDDLVDIEIESVSKIIAKIESDPEPQEVKANELALWNMVKDKCIKGRRTGLGITALGDAIAMMNFKYGDNLSYALVEQIYASLRNEAYRESVDLAKSRGKFPIFNAKNEKNHAFLSRLPEDIQKDIEKYGRRNIACLTTAPAGTVSNLSMCSDGNFGTTSGFEPVFMAAYTRKKKMAQNETKEPDSIGEDGEKYTHFSVQHPGLKLFCEITGKTFEESPYFGAQAGDIEHDKRVKMQGMATTYVDHAISSTVNLSKDIDMEVVAQVYMTAWESQCKGITVYREGSREGILVSNTSKQSFPSNCENCDDAAEKFKQLVKQGGRPGRIILSSAPKRPEVLECDIVRSTIKGQQWVFLIGKLEGQPYEIFGGSNDDLEIPKKFKTGWIKKDGKHLDRTMYDLILGSLENDGEHTRLVINNIANVFGSYGHATFSRVTSLTLRHGVPIKFICEQLIKDPEDDFQSFNRALARVLKSYIEEGEQSGLECPNCHSAKMVYKGGCPSCMVCGTSSCS